jgi:hypothetical protein
MSQEARISSIPVLKELRASLATFAGTASMALEEAGASIQHTRQWLVHDRYRYWRTQVQVRSERLSRAHIALKQKEVFDRTLAGTPSSCVDERKALKLAQAQLQEAEHKLGRVRTWSQQIEKELSNYRGAVHRLASALEVDIPNARAKLDKMIGALEAYLALAPPENCGLEIADGGLEPGSAGAEPVPTARSVPCAGAQPSAPLESEVRKPQSEIKEAP